MRAQREWFGASRLQVERWEGEAVWGQMSECTESDVLPNNFLHLKKMNLMIKCSLFYSMSLQGEKEDNSDIVAVCVCVSDFHTRDPWCVERNPLSWWDRCGVISDDMREVSLLQKAAGSNPGQGIWFTAEMKTLYCSLSCRGISRKHGEVDRRRVIGHLKWYSTGWWYEGYQCGLTSKYFHVIVFHQTNTSQGHYTCCLLCLSAEKACGSAGPLQFSVLKNDSDFIHLSLAISWLTLVKKKKKRWSEGGRNVSGQTVTQVFLNKSPC